MSNKKINRTFLRLVTGVGLSQSHVAKLMFHIIYKAMPTKIRRVRIKLQPSVTEENIRLKNEGRINLRTLKVL